MCVLVCKEADKITAVPLPIPAPAARKRPLAEPALPRLPPFLSLPGAHTGATAQQLPKGNAGRDARKRSSLCGLIILNRYFQPPRSKGRRPAAPGMKMLESCPSVSVGHQTPAPTRRCTVPPRCSASHVFASAPLCPLTPVSTPRTCSHLPLSPSPPRRPAPRGATSNPGLTCGVAPGSPPALLRKHNRRRSPAEDRKSVV